MAALRQLIDLTPAKRVQVITEKIRRVAESQEGVVGRAQLTECGLTGGEISRSEEAGRGARSTGSE